MKNGDFYIMQNKIGRYEFPIIHAVLLEILYEKHITTNNTEDTFEENYLPVVCYGKEFKQWYLGESLDDYDIDDYLGKIEKMSERFKKKNGMEILPKQQPEGIGVSRTLVQKQVRQCEKYILSMFEEYGTPKVSAILESISTLDNDGLSYLLEKLYGLAENPVDAIFIKKFTDALLHRFVEINKTDTAWEYPGETQGLTNVENQIHTLSGKNISDFLDSVLDFLYDRNYSKQEAENVIETEIANVLKSLPNLNRGDIKWQVK